MRNYKLHLTGADALGDVVDETALFRHIASAVPDICFRERFDWPIPTAVIKELERIEDTEQLAAGRPRLLPEE